VSLSLAFLIILSRSPSVLREVGDVYLESVRAHSFAANSIVKNKRRGDGCCN